MFLNVIPSHKTVNSDTSVEGLVVTSKEAGALWRESSDTSRFLPVCTLHEREDPVVLVRGRQVCGRGTRRVAAIGVFQQNSPNNGNVFDCAKSLLGEAPSGSAV